LPFDEVGEAFGAQVGDVAHTIARERTHEIRLYQERTGIRQMTAPRTVRRVVASILVLLGAVLMLFAPPVWVGAIPLAIGIVLELIGIAVERGGRS